MGAVLRDTYVTEPPDKCNAPEHSRLPGRSRMRRKQWSVLDDDALAAIVALVLVGRAKHAEDVLAGAQVNVAIVADALKEQLRRQLQTPAGALTWHRDGLLFEIISWVVARLTSVSNEVISTPHLKSDATRTRYNQNRI